MPSRNRSRWRRRVGVGFAALGLTLLAACSGVSVKPQADGTGAVLPGGGSDPASTSGGSVPPQIRLATDADRHSEGVVASGGHSAPYNYAPSVLQVGGRYRMWWCSQLPGTPRPGDQILYADSASPNGPFAAPSGAPGQQVFGNSPSGFDRLHTCDPSVIDVDGVYYLYYTGTGDPAGNANAIGLATSPDGIHWARANGGAPVVGAAGDKHGSNAYGAGQPSALYLDGWFYLMFTDTTGRAADTDGTGQFVLRSKDPVFRTGVQTLGTSGFAPVASATSVRERSISDTTTSDWMWVDALDAFAIASDTDAGTVISFWDADFDYHPYSSVTIPGAQREGPGLIRRADGHAVVSTTDPCGRVPLDVVRATVEGAGPNGLAHFGLDVDGVSGCRDRATTLALLTGFVVPSPDRTVDLVLGDRLLEVERRSVAVALGVGVLDRPPAVIATLPVVARLKAGAQAVSSPGHPLGMLLDGGRLWVIGDPAVAALNSSPVTTVSAAQWAGYPLGADLTALRP
jgi:hypothetical protein